jgi:hypothetical protein
LGKLGALGKQWDALSNIKKTLNSIGKILINIEKMLGDNKK